MAPEIPFDLFAEVCSAFKRRMAVSVRPSLIYLSDFLIVLSDPGFPYLPDIVQRPEVFRFLLIRLSNGKMYLTPVYSLFYPHYLFGIWKDHPLQTNDFSFLCLVLFIMDNIYRNSANCKKKCFTFWQNRQKSLENIRLYLYNDRRYVTF